MIKSFEVTSDVRVDVFDEFHPPFAEILDVARNDEDHPLYRNYRNINVDSFVLTHLVLYRERPAIFYGLQRAAWMPPNVARAYTRLYKSKEFRDPQYYSLLNGTKFWDAMNYMNYESLWKSKGIDTLIATRNISVKRDAALGVLLRYFGGWRQYPEVCTINDTPQRVMWLGNEEDLSFLRQYSTKP